MRITIVTLVGERFLLDVQSADTVQSAKMQIHGMRGIPVVQQRWMFKGRQMENVKTLLDYGVENGCLIHLVLKLRPAGLPKLGPGEKYTLTQKAFLTFPVEKVEELFSERFTELHAQDEASVYLCAVLEYFSAEVLELSGNYCRNDKRHEIDPSHILKAIENDQELNELGKESWIPQLKKFLPSKKDRNTSSEEKERVKKLCLDIRHFSSSDPLFVNKILEVLKVEEGGNQVEIDLESLKPSTIEKLVNLVENERKVLVGSDDSL